MNTKHTPGPWSVGYSSESGAPQIDAPDFPDTAPIAELWGDYGEANAARIVACVNAMEGIADPAATLHAAKEFLRDFLVAAPSAERAARILVALEGK